MRGVRELSKRFAGGLQRCAYSSKSGGSDFQIAAGVPPVGDRTVYIFPPARTAGQQGIAQTVEGNPAWRIAFKAEGKWINPLIGWTSTADALETSGRAMYFDSKESAVEFAEKNGWNYEVEDFVARDRSRPKRFQGYGDNYSVKRAGIPQGGLRSEQTTTSSSKKK